MGTLGKNFEDVREFVGQRVGDMRVKVENRLDEASSRVGATHHAPPWLVFAAGVLVGAIAAHFAER